MTPYVLHIYTLWIYIMPALDLIDTRPHEGDIIRSTILHFFLICIAASGYYMHCQTRWRLERSIQLEREQLQLSQMLIEKERTFLKNQFNEHTTFNFFNSLYKKVYKQVPEAGEAITLFADFLSYSLRLKFDTYIPLEQEVTYIQRYIQIQQYLNKGVSVSFTQYGCLEGEQILPYLLFPFVENAFKHGVTNDPFYPMRVNLTVNGSIEFTVSNRKNPTNQLSHGIGQENTIRALETFYANKYDLSVQNQPENYQVQLTLHSHDRNNRRRG